MNTQDKKKWMTGMLAATALLAATVTAPNQAEADATLATALGGSALLGLLIHSSQPVGGPAQPDQAYNTGGTFGSWGGFLAHPVVSAPAPQQTPYCCLPAPYYQPAPTPYYQY